MYTFPELIKKIRDEAGITQAEFAGSIGVSTILIAMIESGQKEVSKNVLLKIARKMRVHPASITPFLFINDTNSINNLSPTEETLIRWGERMQNFLIKDRSKNLRK